MLRVRSLHGLECGPGGTKARWLAARLGLAASPPPGVPVVVLHGTDDDVTPLADAESLVDGAGPAVVLHRILEHGTLARVIDGLAAQLRAGDT